ncbi:hypothetical protein [[Phormidium ambiguum] IAM M-71]|uniref:hypothetical protein n=1 Tax=[Phormidium ambiguum] IAM M-71 TaxID=454136 RepID=UPI001F157C67|nr:hypothetical protein [Phormidium ambiguum]
MWKTGLRREARVRVDDRTLRHLAEQEGRSEIHEESLLGVCQDCPFLTLFIVDHDRRRMNPLNIN